MKLSRPVYRHEEIVAGSGMVVAQHRDAARIGVEVLQKGGNAVDAAVTTAFATGVLLPAWNGIGGGGLMVVHLDGGGGGTIDFGMQAPGLSQPEMFELEDTLVVQGPSRRFSYQKVKDNANREGYTSIAIHGTVAGLCAALEKWGSISLDQAVRPAVDIARNGFPLPRTVALLLADRYELLARFETTRRIYLQNDAPLKVGQKFVQSDYAETLERIAVQGPDELYGGETGARMCDDVVRNGGSLRLEDLAQYRPIVHDESLRGRYRDLDVGIPDLPRQPDPRHPVRHHLTGHRPVGCRRRGSHHFRDPPQRSLRDGVRDARRHHLLGRPQGRRWCAGRQRHQPDDSG